MLIIKVDTTSFGQDWAFGKPDGDNHNRIDTIKSRDESLTEQEIIDRILRKYRETLLRFNKIISIEKSDEDFDKYFANMGEI